MMPSDGNSDKLRNGRFAWLLLAAITWCGGFMAFVFVVRILSSLMGPPAGAFVSSMVCMAVAFLSIWILMKGSFHFYEAVGLFVLGAAINLLVYNVFSGLAARLVVGFSLITAGYGMGALLARMVESVRYIVPMCAVATIADIWSVIAGPTRKIIESESRIALQHAFVVYPAAAGASEIQPVAGVTDLVFVALFLCLASRLGLDVRRAALGMFAGLAAGLAIASLVGGVPGIPFLAAGFVVTSWKDVRPGRKEIITTATFIAVMLAIFAAVWVLR